MALFGSRRKGAKRGSGRGSSFARPMARNVPRHSSLWDRDVLHGTLRSELDEPARLHPDFLRLVETAGMWRMRYERGEITRSQLAEQLSQLRVVGPDGAEWTLGATSGQWYRRFHGGEWTPSLPPEAGDVEPADDDVAAPTGQFPLDDATLDELLAVDAQAPRAESVAPEATAALGAAGVGGEAEVPVCAIDPWPSVTTNASEQDLPAYAPAARNLIDDDGVWSSGWESTVRTDGYPAPDAAEPARATGATGTASGIGWAAWAANGTGSHDSTPGSADAVGSADGGDVLRDVPLEDLLGGGVPSPVAAGPWAAAPEPAAPAHEPTVGMRRRVRDEEIVLDDELIAELLRPSAGDASDTAGFDDLDDLPPELLR